MPKRIQRRRTRGWTMPPGALYVGRPTIWGNPFLCVQKAHGDELALKLYENLFSGWNPSIVKSLSDEEVAEIYELHHAWLKRIGIHPLEAAISDLRGRDLACWCPLDALCHGDILLQLVNR